MGLDDRTLPRRAEGPAPLGPCSRDMETGHWLPINPLEPGSCSPLMEQPTPGSGQLFAFDRSSSLAGCLLAAGLRCGSLSRIPLVQHRPRHFEESDLADTVALEHGDGDSVPRGGLLVLLPRDCLLG